MKRVLAGGGLWLELMGLAALSALWTIPSGIALGLGVAMPVIAALGLAPEGGADPKRAKASGGARRWILSALNELGRLTLEQERARWGDRLARRLGERADLAPFARAAGWNPTALALTLGRLGARVDAEREEDRVEFWADRLSSLASDWEKPCGWAAALWGVSPGSLASEQAFRRWNRRPETSDFEALSRRLLAQAERDALREAAPIPQRAPKRAGARL